MKKFRHNYAEIDRKMYFALTGGSYVPFPLMEK